ncbi:hypothetical protein [Haloarchaeobius baliensis]|uniref:hypothetical protein n=1 Tax=Haloarchaeobius baliensis TaxID=1670458 RepID=UPI003F885D27
MSTKSIQRIHVSSVLLPSAVVGFVVGLLGGLWSVLASSSPSTSSFVAFVGAATLGGCLAGVLVAMLYNTVADHIGGVRFEVDDTASRPAPPGESIVDDDVVRCQECQGLEHRERDSCRFCGSTLPST